MSKNDDLVALSSVELRRRIGTKEISPVELLEACIARIEALNPAVNAITATAYDRARREAKAAEKAARAASRWRRCTACRPASRTCTTTKGLLTTYGSPLYRDSVPARDNAMVAQRARGGRHRRRQDQRAGVRRRRQQPQPGVGRHRQSVQSHAQRRRLVGRLGGGARQRHAAGLHRAPTPAARCASRRPIAASSASARRPAWSPSSAARWAGRRSRCSGPMGRTVADTCLLFAAQIGQDDSRSAVLPAGRPERVRRGRAGRSRQPARGVDRGFRPCPVDARDPRDHARARSTR